MEDIKDTYSGITLDVEALLGWQQYFARIRAACEKGKEK